MTHAHHWVKCPYCDEPDEARVETDGEHITFECDFCDSMQRIHVEAAGVRN